jgi:hypothetical protein
VPVALRCDFREPNAIRAAPTPFTIPLYEVRLRGCLLGRSYWLFEIAEVVKISEEFSLLLENVNDV